MIIHIGYVNTLIHKTMYAFYTVILLVCITTFTTSSLHTSCPAINTCSAELQEEEEEEENHRIMSAAPATRKAFIGGNWKCNGLKAQVASLVTLLNGFGEVPVEAEVVIGVPSIHLSTVMSTVRPEIAVSAQDVCIHPGQGAYTGEISGLLLKDFGVNWAIVGHSERRTGFGIPGETNAVVAAKVNKKIKRIYADYYCLFKYLYTIYIHILKLLHRYSYMYVYMHVCICV